MGCSAATPYLSVVISGRNDNYGGDFLQRLQRFVDRLHFLVERHKLPAELILVNYNPIPDREGLRELIDWPQTREYLCIRILSVSAAIHEELVRSGARKHVPLLEFPAKNAGILRARAPFVLATNADILFSDRLVAFIAERSLEKGVLYRTDRLDFDSASEVFSVASTTFEKWVSRKVFLFNLQGGSFLLRWPSSLVWRRRILNAYNWIRRNAYPLLVKSNLGRWALAWINVRPDNLFLLAYPCNACGDFTLLDRESWLRLRAYPETTWIATHTDSLFLMRAVRNGHRISRLPYPIFHQEHERRFDFSERNKDMQRMMEILISEVGGKNAPLTNADDWGLQLHSLPETEC